MKAILAFALLVIAAQATTPAYFLGFTEQLGFNSEQMKHGSVCFDSVSKVMKDIHHLMRIKQMNVREILASTIELLEDVEHKLKIDCSIYMHDIVSTLHRGSQAEMRQIVLKNWNTFGAEIIQQYTIFFDAITAGRDYQAGKTEAYIYQILLGLEKPKVLPVPEFNASRVVSLNFAKYTSEFTKSFYETLGFRNNKGVQENIDCTLAQFYFIEQTHSINIRWNSAQNSSEQLQALEREIHEFANFYEKCAGAYSFNWNEIVMPIARAFKVAPFHASFAVIHNIALNLPEMKHNILQMAVDVNEGRYADAGKIYAEQFLTIITGIF